MTAAEMTHTNSDDRKGECAAKSGREGRQGSAGCGGCEDAASAACLPLSHADAVSTITN